MKDTSAPAWDLSNLYSGISDPAITADLEYLEITSIAFKTNYKGAIRNTSKASNIKRMLDEYASLIEGMRKLEAYAYLEYSVHVTDPTYGAFLQNITSRITNIRSHVIFIETSFASLSEKTLRLYIAHTALSSYKHYLEKKLQERRHILSEEQEHLIQQKSLTGRSAFVRLQQQDLTEKHATLRIGKKKAEYSMSELRNLFHSPDRTLRKKAGLGLAEIAQENLSHSTFAYNTIVQDFSIDTTLRGFNKPEDARHLENEVDGASVQTLCDAVTDAYPLVHEYYNYKRTIMGVKTLYEYDRYAPVGSSKKSYSFSEAKDMVLAAFGTFSPEFHNIASEFFTKHWIHAKQTPQKQMGAYCMYCTPHTNPYVFINYHGSLRDVFTIAHELGHGIQAYLARTQNILHYDWPITIAETASIFGERILFMYLLTTLSPAEQRVLIMSKLEDTIASVFRQVAMYRFEQKSHQARSTQGELTSIQLGNIWMEEQQKMFGTSVNITEAETHAWSLIPHIFQTPFYVYGYAFGELLTLALFALYEKNPRKIAPAYTSFLATGGSKSPEELVRTFSVDLHSRAFWDQGIGEIKALLSRLQ